MDDCASLAPNLRSADVAEMAALAGHGPLEGLQESLEVSEQRFAIEHDGEVIAIFGGSSHPNGGGCGLPWMMASNGLEDHWVWFVRQSGYIVDLVERHYDMLWNLIDQRNTVHMRWLEWCGFEFGPVHQHFGIEGRPFQEFMKFRDV